MGLSKQNKVFVAFHVRPFGYRDIGFCLGHRPPKYEAFRVQGEKGAEGTGRILVRKTKLVSPLNPVHHSAEIGSRFVQVSAPLALEGCLSVTGVAANHPSPYQNLTRRRSTRDFFGLSSGWRNMPDRWSGSGRDKVLFHAVFSCAIPEFPPLKDLSQVLFVLRSLTC